jgi:RNA polymerase sigma-70 factor (ECF subfamily)
MDQFNGENLKGWLTTIAANKCRDYLKRPSKRLDCLSEQDLECLEDQRSSPEGIVLESDAEERVHKVCQKLKEPYKTVATSYFCKNVKLSDIAKDKGQSLKTLQTQLYRAKKLLKVLWKEEWM